MKAAFDQKNNFTIITLTGSITSADCDACKRQLLEHLGQHPARLCVADMGAVDYMDSAGLGVLISVLKHLSLNEGELVLANVMPSCRILFKITRADRIFRIYPSVETAIEELQAEQG